MGICTITFRLLNAFAEENAIEDAIYYLGEALRRQVIDLDVFLKVNINMLLKFCWEFLRFRVSEWTIYINVFVE